MATQEQRKAETRSLLIDAAADLFARKGFHAVSAEAVAEAADRTTGALYSHFGNKEGLLLALLDVWMERTVADLRPALEDVPDLDDRLRALWRGIVQADEGNAEAWVLLEFELWLHSVRDPVLALQAAARFDQARAGLAEGLDMWAAELGFALPSPSADLAAQVIGLLLGAAFQYRLDPAAVPERVIVAGLRQLLGLTGAPPERHHR
jgi:AcrR family transcriptional regulator